MRITRSLFAAAIILFSGAVAAADETIDNPEFASWSKFKAGTSVTFKTVSEFAGMSSETVSKVTLLEFGSDKLVIETASTTNIAGMKVDVPPMKREITKTITLPDAAAKAKAEAEKQKSEAKTEEGTETLKIGGVDCKCKWHRVKLSIMGNESDSKIWTCDDVPGGTVKMESTVSGMMTVKTKFEVTEFKKG